MLTMRTTTDSIPLAVRSAPRRRLRLEPTAPTEAKSTRAHMPGVCSFPRFPFDNRRHPHLRPSSRRSSSCAPCKIYDDGCCFCLTQTERTKTSTGRIGISPKRKKERTWPAEGKEYASCREVGTPPPASCRARLLTPKLSIHPS